MKLKRILIIMLCSIMLLKANIYAKEPEITATSGAVIDCIDGKIWYSKNMDEKLYPASLTKILTAILVVENCDMKDEVVISQSAIDNVQEGYVTSNIQAGESLTIEDLLHLLLLSSCNDIANVLAEHVGGSIEEFTIMMNEKAKDIGCTNSNFVNSNGEHNVNHYSTAHDMALIGKYAMQYDEIKSIVSKTEYTYQKTGETYYTTNEMLLSGSRNYYKYAKGVKTGFTTPAGSCLMVYTEKNDIPLITVVLKSTTSDSKYDDSLSILEYAYQNNTLKTIAGVGTTIQTVNIKHATEDTKKMNAVLENTIIAVVKDENKDINVEPQISMNENLKAPIEKGTVVGTVSYEIEGKTYKANLVAENEVKKSHTGLILLLVFLGILVILGGLRIFGIYKRTKTLKKIRENK